MRGFSIGLVEKTKEALKAFEKSGKKRSNLNAGSSKLYGNADNGDNGGLVDGLSRILSVKRKSDVAVSRWTAAVTAIVKQNGNQIGTGTETPERNVSIADLRDTVMREEETAKGRATVEEAAKIMETAINNASEAGSPALGTKKLQPACFQRKFGSLTIKSHETRLNSEPRRCATLPESDPPDAVSIVEVPVKQPEPSPSLVREVEQGSEKVDTDDKQNLISSSSSSSSVGIENPSLQHSELIPPKSGHGDNLSMSKFDSVKRPPPGNWF